MDNPWQYWLAFGLLLLVMETLTGTFVALCFGIGAALLGLLMLLVPPFGLWLQVVAWAGLSAPIAGVWLWRQRRVPPERRWTADEALGEVGLLTVAIDEFAKGRARFQKPLLGSEEWPCLADAPIPAGARVRVVAVLGASLRVAPA